MKAVVDEEGITVLDRRRVWWGRFTSQLPVGEGSTDWQSVLEAILADYRPGETRGGPTWKSVNGIASAANSASGGAPMNVLAAAISQAFRTHREHAGIASHPRFDEFVTTRARAFRTPKPAATTTRRQRGSAQP